MDLLKFAKIAAVCAVLPLLAVAMPAHAQGPQPTPTPWPIIATRQAAADAQLAVHMTESRMARLNAMYQSKIAAEYSTLNMLPAARQTIDQHAATTHQTEAQAEPSKMDSIKQRLGEVLHIEPKAEAEPAMQTLAAEGEAIEVQEPAPKARSRKTS